MNAFLVYELECPACRLRYTQMISRFEEDLPMPCPCCGAAPEKLGKPAFSELLSCVSSHGGT